MRGSRPAFSVPGANPKVLVEVGSVVLEHGNDSAASPDITRRSHLTGLAQTATVEYSAVSSPALLLRVISRARNGLVSRVAELRGAVDLD